jgi:uncharacterized protein
MPKNSVVHFEIYGDEPDKLAQFYTKLFDWRVQPIPEMDYRMVYTVDTDSKGMPAKPGGINGGMAKRPGGFKANSWVSYISVDSVDDAVRRAEGLGAKVTNPKSPVPGMGWFAMMLDPEGNSFAVWQEDSSAK